LPWLPVSTRTTPAITTELSRWERRQYIDLVTHQLARWQPDRPSEERQTWAAVIIAGIDGLIDAWLTIRDDEACIAAATLFAGSVSTLVEQGR
jgi:hypothetical protein